MNTKIADITQSPDVMLRVANAAPRSSRSSPGLLSSLGLAALLSFAQSAAWAATAPPLGSTGTYGVVSSTFTNSNTAPQTIINGDVCYTTAPVTPPLTITGATVVPCPPATGTDQGLAVANLNGQVCTFLGAGAITLDSVVIGANPPGTIPPGCYFSGGAMNVTATTTVTLNGAGVYVFRPGGALTTGANSRVVLAGGACASDVFWAPVAATTLGANAALSPTPTFVGTILDAAGITIGQFANLTGRALAFGGTVTTDAVTISVPTCAPFVGGAVTLTGVQSRKVHGSAGPFNLPIDTTQAFAGSVTVEPRVIGTGHTIVFQFNRTVTVPGTPSASDAFGPVGSVSAAITGASNTPANNEVSVTLTGIPDNTRITISLTQVNGVLDVAASMGFLVGDVNNTRSVTSIDISNVKARSGQSTAAASFLFDLNASGTINSSDISVVKVRSGLTLPAANEGSLLVSKVGTGVGSVSSMPAGINCGGACSANFAHNTSITLTATVNTGSTFTGWSGACTGAASASTFVLGTSSVCNANFTINTYAVTPSAGLNGTIGPSTIQTTNHGAAAIFTVTPTNGSYPSVGGTCGGALVGSTYTTKPITAPCTVEATFYPWPVWSSVIPVVPPSSTGNTFYVDGTNGVDTSNGITPTSAFKTLAKAMSVLAAGDTMLIRRGLYRERLDLLAGGVPTGTAAKPIVLASYGDGEVILDGSTLVTGWTLVSGTVWQAPKTFNPVGVVVNEVPLWQVRQGQNGSTAPQDGLAGVTSGSGKWHNGVSFITADMGTTIGSGDPNLADIVVPNDNGGQQHVYFYQHAYVTFKGLTVRGSGNAGIWGYGNNITIESCNIKFNGKAGIDFEFDGTAGKTNADNAVLTSNIYHNVLTNWPRGNNGYQESGGGWPGAVGWGFQLRPLARGNIVHTNGGEGIITYGARTGRVTGSAMFEQNVAFDNWSINMYFDNQPNNVARNNFLFNHPTDNNNFLYVGAFPYNAPGKFTGCLMLADEQNSSDGVNGYASLTGSQVYNNIMAGCRFGIRDYSEGVSAIANHGLKNTIIVNNTIIMPFNPIPNTSTFGILLQDNTASGTQRNVNSIIQNNVIYGYNNDAVIFTQLNGAQTGININNNMYFSSSAAPFGAGFNTVSNYNFAGWKAAITGADTNSFFADPLFMDITQFRAAAPTPYLIDNANLGPTSPARNAGTPQTFLPAVNFNLMPRAGWNIGAF